MIFLCYILTTQDATCGQAAVGARPYAFSRFGSTSIDKGEQGLRMSIDGAMYDLVFVLTLTSCKGGATKACGTSA